MKQSFFIFNDYHFFFYKMENKSKAVLKEKLQEIRSFATIKCWVDHFTSSQKVSLFVALRST